MTDVNHVKVTRNPIKGKVLAISKDARTVKVEVARIVPNKFYGKRIHAHTTVFADCPQNKSVVLNSEVEIFPCRRISKNKTWKVTRGTL